MAKQGVSGANLEKVHALITGPPGEESICKGPRNRKEHSIEHGV